MDAAKKASIISAVNRLKDGPFKTTGIKVEMEGRIEREWDCERIEEWFKENLSPGANNALVYIRCYPDGGDTEVTFTLRLDNPENIFYLPEFVTKYRELARVAGNGEVNIINAGMHMALLNEPSCRYPGQNKEVVTSSHVENLKRSMSLLMPALFFLGATYEMTRSFGPRGPRVSASDKYSAIAYRQGALEFRVFDTCYDQPEQILDNVVVMANVMQFFTPEYKPVKMGVPKVRFGKSARAGLQPLEGHYTSRQHLLLLNAGLRILKPDYLTVEDIKAQRKFGKTDADCNDYDTEFERMAREKFAEYQEREQWRERAEIYYAKAVEMEQGYGRHSSPADALKAATKRVAAVKKQLRVQRMPFETFKARLPRPEQGDYELVGE